MALCLRKAGLLGKGGFNQQKNLFLFSSQCIPDHYASYQILRMLNIYFLYPAVMKSLISRSKFLPFFFQNMIHIL